MKHWYQRPNPSLSEYVRTALILEESSHTESSDLPIVTNGMQALLCRMEKEQTGGSWTTRLMLCGKSIPSEYWQVDQNTIVIAWFFMPFAMATLFNVPAAKLLDQPIELDNWMPHQTNALKTQLAFADSTNQKVEVLEYFLTHQLQENNKVCEIIRQATDQIMCDSNPEILSALVQKLKINQRTFQRTFKKYVGITPNHYRRICQFQL